VKYVLPCAAILTLAVCALARAERKVVNQPSVIASEAGRSESSPTPAAQSSSQVPPVPEKEPEVPPGSGAPSTASVQVPSMVEDRSQAQEILESLAPLELSEEQADRTLAVLQDRAEELKRLHREIRSSGVFNPGKYSRELLHGQDLWFRRIDALLDVRQHETFLDLVRNQGVLRHGTDFTVHNGELTIVR